MRKDIEQLNNNGELDLTVSGTSSYTVDWDIDGVGDNDDVEDLSGLGPGTYSVIINDLSTGCVAALSEDVNEPDTIGITDLNTPVTCFGLDDFFALGAGTASCSSASSTCCTCFFPAGLLCKQTL